MCSFPSIVAAAETVKEIIQTGIAVSCVELLDDVMIQAINAKNKSGGSTRVWEEKPTLFLKLQEGDIEKTRQFLCFVPQLILTNIYLQGLSR